MSKPETPSVFEFRDYKTFVLRWIESRSNGGHGEKSRMAKKMNCQLAYVSQVLTGPAHFSLEQAAALSAHFELTEEESDFFLLLVQRARAGTPILARHFDRKIETALNHRAVLKNRFRDKTSLSREDQVIYYSDWTYSALHLAVLIPGMRTPGALAKYFGISPEKTSEVLQFLESVGLVTRNQGEYLPGQVRIHLENDSPMISKHHVNWRLQAMQSLDTGAPGELHYSSVVTVSKADLPRVREILVKAIEQVRAVIKNSKDEEVYSYAVDLFGLRR